MIATFDVRYEPDPDSWGHQKIISKGLSLSSTGVKESKTISFLNEALSKAVVEVLTHPDAPKVMPEGATLTITRRRL